MVVKHGVMASGLSFFLSERQVIAKMRLNNHSSYKKMLAYTI